MSLRRASLVLLGVLVATTLAIVGVAAQSQSGANAEATPELTPQETLQREKVMRVIDEAFIPGDFAVLDEYLSEDYVVHSPFGDLDREGTKGFLGALRSALSDFQAVREPVVVEGNLVATRNVFTGIFTTEFAGPTGPIQPNNQPVVFEFITIFRFDEDGMIVEEWVQFDTLGFFTQLGAMPAN
ncbi:MAG: ester cyclase [Chloroflexi bacterium]|nr:ester cyclase [Chloroflexota bacterium]